VRADILALDRDGRPVLFIKVKAVPPDEQTHRWFFDDLANPEEAPESIAFAMLIDPAVIRVYRREPVEPHPLVAEFDTLEIIRHYAPDFTVEPGESLRMLRRVMITFVEIWLWDLAFPVRPADPPKQAELAAIGLLPLLERGTTINREREESADRLR
jgi:hypothetical protein